MKRSLLAPTCVALLATAIGVLHAQRSAAQLTGRVVDSSGASINHATVILYQWHTETPPAAIREVARFNTDSFGEFSGQVPTGKYDLVVLSTFTVPAAQRITVTLQPLRISIQLSEDPDLPREECCGGSVPTTEVKPQK